MNQAETGVCVIDGWNQILEQTMQPVLAYAMHHLLLQPEQTCEETGDSGK